MADTYTTRSRMRKQGIAATGDVWGAKLNEDVLDIADATENGEKEISIGSSTSYSLAAMVDGELSDSHYYSLIFTGTPASAVTITIPASVTRRKYQIKNSTGQTATVKYAASTGVVLCNGDQTTVWCDGSEVHDRGPGYRITPAETAAGVTPVDCDVPSHDVSGKVNAKRYGLSESASVATNTTAIQAAINVLSHSTCRIVLVPGGAYSHNKLYGYYDVSLNPGYNSARADASFTFLGDGISSETGDTYGTVMTYAQSTGDGFTISPAANDANPYPARDVIVKGISFKGDTTGWIITCLGVVSARFEDFEIVNDNAAGNGLKISTAYFGVLKNPRIRGSSSGIAIDFSTSIAAGLLTIENPNVSGYSTALNMSSGDWQVMNVIGGEMSGSTYDLYVSGRIQQLNYYGHYFEGAKTSFIAMSGANKIFSLNLYGCWYLGSGLTDVGFDLQSPNAVSIQGGVVQDLANTFMNIDALPSGGFGNYDVCGLTFNESSPIGTPVTYFTGILPALRGVDYPVGNANVSLFDPDERPIRYFPYVGQGKSVVTAGHVFGGTIYNGGAVGGGSVTLQDEGSPEFSTFYCTTSDTTIYLPEIATGLQHGFNMTVQNDVASSNSLIIKTAVADGGDTLGTLVAEGQRTFRFFDDGVTTGWK